MGIKTVLQCSCALSPAGSALSASAHVWWAWSRIVSKRTKLSNKFNLQGTDHCAFGTKKPQRHTSVHPMNSQSPSYKLPTSPHAGSPPTCFAEGVMPCCTTIKALVMFSSCILWQYILIVFIPTLGSSEEQISHMIQLLVVMKDLHFIYLYSAAGLQNNTNAPIFLSWVSNSLPFGTRHCYYSEHR